jgi:SAM-dependent methyltransferase
MTSTSTDSDLVATKQRQQATWAAGDYSVIGITLQIVGERLCEAVDIRSGERVLDVAAGNGNASLAAARHWCEVTSTDYVESLLDRGRTRAVAEGRHIDFREADAEALPFAAGSFDVVLSNIWRDVRAQSRKGCERDAERLSRRWSHRARQLDARGFSLASICRPSPA